MRSSTDGDFVRTAPSSKVHPAKVAVHGGTDKDRGASQIVEMQEVRTDAGNSKQQPTTSAVDPSAAKSQSSANAKTPGVGLTVDTQKMAQDTSPEQGSPQAGINRMSSIDSVGTTDSVFDPPKNWDAGNHSPTGRLGKHMSTKRQRSLIRLKKKLARSRTRDRALKDKVDQLEQKLAKYMYQTMGLKQAFEYYDKDGNAGLDEGELGDLLEKCNAEYGEEEFEGLMNRYDADKNGVITLDEFTTTVPISRPRLLEYLKEKEEQRAACLSLPLTVLFFIWFVILLSLHDVTGAAYAVETGVMSDLISRSSTEHGITFYETDTVEKLWDWLSTVLLPVAFSQTVPGTDNRDIPPYAWGTVNQYNHFLGAGISMQQTRSGTGDCSVADLQTPLNATCHPWEYPLLATYPYDDNFPWSSNESFGVALCSQLAATLGCADASNCTTLSSNDCYDDTGVSNYVASTISAFSVVAEDDAAIDPYPVYDPPLPSFEVLLDASQTQAEIRTQLDYLRGREWVDASTKHMQLLFAIYNGEYGTYMAVNLMWEVNRGGALIPSIKLQDSIPADPYDNNNGWIWLVDVGWIIMVLAQAVGEFGEMRERRLKYWKDPWNVLDWMQIVLTLALMVFWFEICFSGLYPLSQLWRETYNSSDVFVRQEPTTKLLLLLDQASDYRTGVVINIMIILVRFFKAFLVQPRLSIVTITFVRSFVDVVHFMVILSCLLFGFVFTGIYLLGHKVSDFSDVGDALMRLYQAMIAVPLLKWDEVKVAAKAADGYSMATMWYILFLFVIGLVFKSMLLAIIMTAYAEARNKAGSKARTMWAQLAHVIVEYRAGSQGCLQLSQVIDCLDHAPEDVPLNEEALYLKDSVNIHDILAEYNRDGGGEGHLKKGTKAEMEFRKDYAKRYMLKVVAEYFDFIDLKDPTEAENRQKEASARISELDTDFKELEKRLTQMQATFHTNFSRMFEMLEDLKESREQAHGEHGNEHDTSHAHGPRPTRTVVRRPVRRRHGGGHGVRSAAGTAAGATHSEGTAVSGPASSSATAIQTTRAPEILRDLSIQEEDFENIAELVDRNHEEGNPAQLDSSQADGADPKPNEIVLV